MIRPGISDLLWDAQNNLEDAREKPKHNAVEASLIISLDALIKAVKSFLREAH